MAIRHIAFATQGGEFSYHAQAARMIAAGKTVTIEDKSEFKDVIKASRRNYPGMGVIAIQTVVGTVHKSVRQIISDRPSALPPIVGRVDVPVELFPISTHNQTLQDIRREGMVCIAQREALEQCRDEIQKLMPFGHFEKRKETTRAVKEVKAMNDPNQVALGPAFAADALGCFVLTERPINPPDSVTSFYVLQRDPREELLPPDPRKTSPRTVISLIHPEGKDKLEEIVKLAMRADITMTRVLPFDFSADANLGDELSRAGGLIELGHDMYDERVTEWCARLHGLETSRGQPGPFKTEKLGGYAWYPEETTIDPQTLLS